MGKIHIAVSGIGKAFCGHTTMVESGDWFSKKQIVSQKDEICKVCLCRCGVIVAHDVANVEETERNRSPAPVWNEL